MAEVSKVGRKPTRAVGLLSSMGRRASRWRIDRWLERRASECVQCWPDAALLGALNSLSPYSVRSIHVVFVHLCICLSDLCSQVAFSKRLLSSNICTIYTQPLHMHGTQITRRRALWHAMAIRKLHSSCEVGCKGKNIRSLYLCQNAFTCYLRSAVAQNLRSC